MKEYVPYASPVQLESGGVLLSIIRPPDVYRVVNFVNMRFVGKRIAVSGYVYLIHKFESFGHADTLIFTATQEGVHDVG